METYYIHDNFRRPFKVEISKNYAKIYKQNIDKKSNRIIYENKVFLEYKTKQIFIGESPRNPMTEFSGGYGSSFDGNSILLKLFDDTYVFIGSRICSFKAFSEITNFISPVGNNDVPYPYAIDKNNNNYLLCKCLVMKNVPEKMDPYDYYYEIKPKKDDKNLNCLRLDNFRLLHDRLW